MEKGIQNRDIFDYVMARADVCRLGLCKDGMPYIVPVSFGYDGAYIYFHTAPKGMKIDFINANNRICFELEHEAKAIPHETDACKWSFSFYCVVGFGSVEEIADPSKKVDALQYIMKHYSDKEWGFSETFVKATRLWRISIEQATGKKSKDKPAISILPVAEKITTIVEADGRSI